MEGMKISDQCAVCRCKILPENRKDCSICQTPHHQECFDKGGCALYACKANDRNMPASSQAHMGVAVAPSSPIFQSACIICLVLLAGLSYVIRTEESKVEFIPKIFKEKIENVSAVYMHDLGDYSVSYSETPTSSEIKTRRLPGGNWILFRDQYYDREINPVKIYRDVPADKSMWVYIVGTNNYRYPTYPYALRVEIHIHSAQSIDGGGWDRRVGKTGYLHGQVNVVDAQ